MSKKKKENLSDNILNPSLVPTTPQPDQPPVEGPECKNCGCRHFYVGRTIPRGKKIFRYKYCRNCGKGITTEERQIGELKDEKNVEETS